MVYIDDFCTYSSQEHHIARVEEGLKWLAQLGGQLNETKCHIGESKVALLGHTVFEAALKQIQQRCKHLQRFLALLQLKSSLLSSRRSSIWGGLFTYFLS